jgi:hypothetical protein
MAALGKSGHSMARKSGSEGSRHFRNQEFFHIVFELIAQGEEK